MSSIQANATLRIVPVHEADIDQVAALVNRAFSRYSDIFKGSRTSPQDYRDEVRRQLLEGRLIQLRIAGRVKVTETDARAAYAHGARKIKRRNRAL